MATRLHSVSASERMWLLKKMVRPSSRSARISARTSRRPSGSSPDIGSSRNTTSGSLTSACARPSRCTMPFEYRRTARRRSAPMPTRSSSDAARVRASRGGHAAQLSEVGQQFLTGQVVVERGVLGQEAHAAAHRDVVEWPPENRGAPRGREHQAHQQLQGGGLAGAVGSQAAEHLATTTSNVRASSARYGFGRQKPTG